MSQLIAFFVSWFDNRHGHLTKVSGAAAIGMLISILSVIKLSLERPCTKVEILGTLIGVPLFFGIAASILSFRDGLNSRKQEQESDHEPWEETVEADEFFMNLHEEDALAGNVSGIVCCPTLSWNSMLFIPSHAISKPEIESWARRLGELLSDSDDILNAMANYDTTHVPVAHISNALQLDQNQFSLNRKGCNPRGALVMRLFCALLVYLAGMV